MHPIIEKTFGGLSSSYYVRQFVFGLALTCLIYAMASSGGHALHVPMLFVMIVNTLLYPYSTFIYEKIVHFIVGENLFLVSGLLMLATKVVSMLFCWAFAVLTATLGLAFLYWHHSKPQN